MKAKLSTLSVVLFSLTSNVLAPPYVILDLDQAVLKAEVSTSNLEPAVEKSADSSHAVIEAEMISVSLESLEDVDVFLDEVAAIASPPPPPQIEEEQRFDDAEANEQIGNAETRHVNPPPAGSIAETALQYVGYPYVWGASGPNSFDCSGFTSYIYAQHGLGLSRSSYEQAYAGTAISQAEAVPGDLVVWTHLGHVAIYLGDGMIVHASNPRDGVKISSLYGSYYFLRV